MGFLHKGKTPTVVLRVAVVQHNGIEEPIEFMSECVESCALAERPQVCIWNKSQPAIRWTESDSCEPRLAQLSFDPGWIICAMW